MLPAVGFVARNVAIAGLRQAARNAPLLIGATALSNYRKMPSFYRTVTGDAKRQRIRSKTRSFKSQAISSRNQFIFKGVHNFKRSLQFNSPFIPNTGIQWATTNAFGGGLITSLSQIAKTGGGATTTAAFSGFAELSSLFDLYRIVKLRVTMYYTANTQEATPAAVPAAGMPVIYYAEDNSDGQAPGAVTSIMEYGNVKSFQFGGGNNKLVINITPRALNTASFGTPQAPASTWYTTNNSNQEFYGLKFWIPQTGTAATATGNFVVMIDQFMQFKDQQ